jgi:4-amino-4-deoxy-L-arabinose transferase-like glycosyltransferase
MKKSTLILSGLILIKFLLQYSVIAPVYELHRDEFLHLDQGKHIAMGFVSVPPLTSWFSWIIFELGGGEFWVKFFPAAFGALTMVFAWKIVEEMKGKLFACLFAATAIMLSAILRINTLFQPNSFDILAWTIVYYCLVCFVNRNDNRFLIWAGVAAGFGFLNKYSILFLILGLFLHSLYQRNEECYGGNRH